MGSSVRPAITSDIAAMSRTLAQAFLDDPVMRQSFVNWLLRSHTIVLRSRFSSRDAIELDEQIDWEAEQQIPYDIKDVQIDYEVDATIDEVLRRCPDTVVVATGATASRPWWAPGDAAWIVDVRDVLTGAAHPEGSVVVLDELGFHHATSVAEVLADRGCDVEVISPGMVVGQDLGITLDLENWWIRAEAKGIVQSTELVPMGVEVADDGSHVVNLQHHPTGTMQTRAPDWMVLAVPAAPADGLFYELKGSSELARRGVEVHRVGDAVAPRRAHAAVIDGERIGAAIPSAARSMAVASA